MNGERTDEAGGGRRPDGRGAAGQHRGEPWGGSFSFPELPPAGLLFGLGIDVIAAARMKALLERLPRAADRLFSPQEQEYSRRFADPYPRFAARFAAKEAVGKALGIGIIGFVWRDIEVLSGGKPLVALHGGVAQIARRLGVTRVELSLSHTAGMAYAVAAALKEER